MALSKLSGDEAGIVFVQLCNVLDPRIAVALSSVSHELREPMLALLQQLRADHEAAAALCHKVGMRSCKELREARQVNWQNTHLSLTDLATLGSLGSVLPALQQLILGYSGNSFDVQLDGAQRLAERLGTGALPAVTHLALWHMRVSDAGASALAAALGRGVLPRLKLLALANAAISDAGLVALAPALRRLPALENLNLRNNSFGDVGVEALVAPLPPPAGAPPTPTAGLAKLQALRLKSVTTTLLAGSSWPTR